MILLLQPHGGRTGLNHRLHPAFSLLRMPGRAWAGPLIRMMLAGLLAPLAASTLPFDPACPCIDVTEKLAGARTSDGVVGYVGYGSVSCEAWDLHTPPCNVTSRPDWCLLRWCFVDGLACRESDRYFRSSLYFPDVDGLWFSYSTCELASDQQYDSVSSSLAEEGQAGLRLRVAFPAINYPYHYKLRADGSKILEYLESGPEYRNDSIPWHGIYVRYMRALERIAPWGSVTYTFVSGGAHAVAPDGSSHTAAVVDVGARVVDIAASDFWVTPARVNIAAFSTTVTSDRIFLWVPRVSQKPDDFWKSASKVFLPFSFELWMAVVAALVGMSLFDMWLCRDHVRRRLNEAMGGVTANDGEIAANDGGHTTNDSEHTTSEPPQWRKRLLRCLWLTLLEWLHHFGRSYTSLVVGLPSDGRADSVPLQLAWYGWAGFILLMVTACAHVCGSNPDPNLDGMCAWAARADPLTFHVPSLDCLR